MLMIFVANLQILNSVKLNFLRHPVWFVVRLVFMFLYLSYYVSIRQSDMIVDSTNILYRMIFFMVYVFGGFPLVWTLHYSICVYDECQQCPEGFLWIRPCQLNRLLSKYNLLRRTSLKTNFCWIELSTHSIYDMDSTFML